MESTLLIWLCLRLAFVYGSNSSAFQQNKDIADKTCRKRDRAFNTVFVPSSLICASCCASNQDCESFFYSATTGMCDGCIQTYTNAGEDNKRAKGMIYYAPPITEIVQQDFDHIGCLSEQCSYGPCRYEYSFEIDGLTVDMCYGETMYYEVISFALQGNKCMIDVWYETRAEGCDIACAGNPAQKCGGKGVVSFYQIRVK